MAVDICLDPRGPAAAPVAASPAAPVKDCV